jgi:O-acetyl-ADP-ribose deacetylase (regulator of RNase III)
MAIKIVTGNLLEDEADALVNAVNTVGIMGKGIALQFKLAFPHNFKIYQQACKEKSFVIGEILAVKDSSVTSGEKLIINFPTKIHWRNPSKYEYIESGLRAFVKLLEDHNIKSVAMPKLGVVQVGLNGLS